ncbi:MAG: hypothetical protein GY791_08195 [Alphaproteobacteria bacterium]|nr:hypothetical protein [Alphaproteobacteria bacterium]
MSQILLNWNTVQGLDPPFALLQPNFRFIRLSAIHPHLALTGRGTFLPNGSMLLDDRLAIR